jgi:hypothetical protein
LRTTDQLLRWLGGYSSSDLPSLPLSESTSQAALPVAPPVPQSPREGNLMTRIVQAVRGTPTQRLEAERRAAADVEREIADLEQRRADALLADAPDDALALAERIEAAERRLATHADGRRAATDKRQQEKEAALEAFEKNFAENRVAAATRIIQAVRDLSTALQDHAKACRGPFASWPHHLFPNFKTFEGSSYSYVPATIASALRMQNSGAALTLLVDLPARIGDLAERDVKLCASLLEDIRMAPLPKQPKIDDEEIAA